MVFNGNIIYENNVFLENSLNSSITIQTELMRLNSTPYIVLLAFLFISTNAIAQSTFADVYQIFQTSCTFSSCHDNDGPALGMDLQGSNGGDMMEVYNNIVNVDPTNSTATANDNKRILPGDPSRSFIFRKIQNGLDPTVMLHDFEGDPMPLFGTPLNEKDIELVRQWILHGAPATGTVIDTNIIASFYDNNGLESVPNPPQAPDPSEGFQIHLGPFFVPPGTEDEVFIKHDLHLTEDIEVVAVETHMGIQSHHFILNKFLEEDETICGIEVGSEGPDAFEDGFRGVDDPSHFSALFQVGAQESGKWELPYKTAFAWDAGTVVDLNSHYINANQNQVLSADVYINVYTQPEGIAKQDMQALMIPNTELNIPSNGQEIVVEQNLPVYAPPFFTCFPNGLFLYSLNTHTHRLGTDYDIYLSNIAGQEVEHLLDASCYIDGVPGCTDEFYDYQHPPERIFEDYKRLESSDWLKHKAKYVNNTGSNVGWGLTSEDEMMIMFLFYVNDTSGLFNLAPEVGSDAATTNQDEEVIIPVLANDSDDDGVLVCGIETNPTNGTVEINEDETITYTPNSGFSGTDQFEYIACDDVNNGALSSTGMVNVTVNAPTGLFDNTYKLVNVYPNPTNGYITIPTQSNQVKSVQLLNIQGQLLDNLQFSQQGNLLNADLKSQNIPRGMYWIVIENNDNSKGVAKVIFQN